SGGIDRAVSGVRSWCEASAVSSRSAASRLLSLRADVSRPSATWSRSAVPYLRPSGRGSPRPSRAAASASSSTGRASRPASTAVSQPASAAATAITAAIAPSSAPPSPASITRAGTPTTRTATSATAKLANHSRLRTAHPAAWSVALKAEPDAPDRGDVPGAVRVVAELAAQPGNVHVERLGRGPPLRVPDLAHDLLPGDHLARVAQQDPEQVEFLGGQVDVEQDQVDALAQRLVQRAGTVRRHVDLVSLPAQGAGQRFGDRGVVLSEQYAGHE